jgi:hypothetical protein
MPETPKHQYMCSEGFALSTDFGHQVFDDACSFPVQRIDQLEEIDFSKNGHEPSALALWMVADTMTDRLKELVDYRNPSTLKKYGVTHHDRGRQNLFTFEYGLADIDFTWQFGPAVARTVVDEATAAGHVTPYEQQQMTLRDYGDILRVSWFRDIMHDLALARNGIWGKFGSFPGDYKKGMLLSRIKEVSSPFSASHLFEFSEQQDVDGQSHIVAQVSSELRKALRQSMQNQGTIGCPVARRAGAVPKELLASNPHMQHLIKSGNLSISYVNTASGRVRYTQEETPIDKALRVLGDKLEEYHDRFGTPFLEQQDAAQAQGKESQGIFMRQSGFLRWLLRLKS